MKKILKGIWDEILKLPVLLLIGGYTIKFFLEAPKWIYWVLLIIPISITIILLWDNKRENH